MTSQVERTLYDQSFEDNPVFRRIFSRLPSDVSQSFSNDQLYAIYWATAFQVPEHTVAIRKRLKFFRKRFYVAFFLGLDRRKKLTTIDKFLLSGMRHPVLRPLLLLCLYFMVLFACIVPMVIAVYVVKSLAGLDIMDDTSFLHDLFWASSNNAGS